MTFHSSTKFDNEYLQLAGLVEGNVIAKEV